MHEQPVASERLSLRVPQELKADLQARAEAAGKHPADWHRDVIIAALYQHDDDPTPPAHDATSLHMLAAWIDRRIQAQEAKQKCDMNAIFSFIRILLEQTMYAEAFARSVATAYLPDDEPDAEQLIEEYERDVQARCEALVEDFNHNILGEARDEGRRREAAADASLDGLKERLEERPS